MEPHAVPRQITTFEFKLIGFLTLKEFAYLVVFAGLSAIAYFTAPFELAKYASAAAVFGVGAFLAFFKYNDRSIDVWIRNLAIKLLSSSQYYYHKHGEPPSFLRDITYDPQIARLHVDAKRKLTGYLKTGSSVKSTPDIQIQAPTPTPIQEPEVVHKEALPVEPNSEPIKESVSVSKPLFSGVVKNSKDLPLPNILVYIKNKDGQVARILKTNSHGVFSTNRPLDDAQYVVEPKDSGNRFFFDTMSVDSGSITQPLIIRSKEVL